MSALLPALADERFRDPFVYCAAVGTTDAAGDRYIGPKMAAAIEEGLKTAMAMPADAPTQSLTANSLWRCMNGRVYACTVGANLPCSEKADTARQPSAAVVEFCQRNPGAEVIPMAVTGRATVFEWKCESNIPAIVRQFTEPDAQGYLANIWYQIEPPAH
jgi:hypothetical protein